MLEKKATTTEQATELVVDGCLILLLVMKFVLALLLIRTRRVSTKSQKLICHRNNKLALLKSELF